MAQVTLDMEYRIKKWCNKCRHLPEEEKKNCKPLECDIIKEKEELRWTKALLKSTWRENENIV